MHETHVALEINDHTDGLQVGTRVLIRSLLHSHNNLGLRSRRATVLFHVIEDFCVTEIWVNEF